MSVPPGVLLWRCRRGVRELDVLLETYLRERHPTASPAEQAAFVELLNLPNQRLLDYLFGNDSPDQGLAREIVDHIRRQPPA